MNGRTGRYPAHLAAAMKAPTELMEQPGMLPADAQQTADNAVMVAFADGWRCGLEAGAERGTAA